MAHVRATLLLCTLGHSQDSLRNIPQELQHPVAKQLESVSLSNSGIDIAFLGDSQYTANTLNPMHIQTDWKRRNLVVKIHRVMRMIHVKHPQKTMLFIWGPSHVNTSDLNSKSHPKLLQIVNGDLWRHGPKEFYGNTFPSENMLVYGHFKNGTFTFTGLK